jgi:hypothetical protein
MNSKEKAFLDRIERIEEAITKAREYLESGKHADWHGFRPFLVNKVRDGKVLSPHKDWVKNVFLPRQEGALRRNQRLLEKLPQKNTERANHASQRIAHPDGFANVEG